MGGRTAVHVADDPNVRGVVALAPWLPPGESVEALRGKTLYAAHGSRDRITSARGTAAYVRRAAEVAETAEFRDMGRVGHYLLRGRRRGTRSPSSPSLRVLANRLTRLRHDERDGLDDLDELGLLGRRGVRTVAGVDEDGGPRRRGPRTGWSSRAARRS